MFRIYNDSMAQGTQQPEPEQLKSPVESYRYARTTFVILPAVLLPIFSIDGNVESQRCSQH